MVDPALRTKWLYWLIFCAFSVAILFFQLIPLQTSPSNWAMPDLLVCIIFAWGLRRSDYTPVLLIAIILLVADMLLMRPPGLMAGLIVLGAEFLRARTQLLRELPFPLEWAMVAGVLLAILVANRFVLILVMQPRPDLWLSLTQLITTLAAYPLVVLVSRFVLGIRKIATGEVDALGHRI